MRVCLWFILIPFKCAEWNAGARTARSKARRWDVGSGRGGAASRPNVRRRQRAGELGMNSKRSPRRDGAERLKAEKAAELRKADGSQALNANGRARASAGEAAETKEALVVCAVHGTEASKVAKSGLRFNCEPKVKIKQGVT